MSELLPTGHSYGTSVGKGSYNRVNKFTYSTGVSESTS